jgi:uncharacterized protein YdeI (YjbR/CyaY-like superfamily)
MTMRKHESRSGKTGRGLSREIIAMPEFVEKALRENKLATAYFERPAYQQNDYVSWITRAKRPETREKRLNQMLDELRRGGVYMNMKHRPSRRP